MPRKTDDGRGTGDQPTGDGCYFCREPADSALDEHHVVPRRLRELGWESDKRVTLCSNCHRKYHELTDELVDFLINPRNRDSRAPTYRDNQRSSRDIKHQIRAIINGQGKVRPNEIIEQLADMGIDSGRAEKNLNSLLQDGVVYETKYGKLRVSDSEWSDRFNTDTSGNSGGEQ